MSTARDLHSLANAIERARPEVTETDRRITSALYRLFSGGQPVAAAELAAAAELSESEVETRLEKWPGVCRDERDRVVGFWGLTGLEMPPHEIFLDGGKLWAWCAWDTPFPPRRLGARLDVHSRCPTTGQEIMLRVAPEDVESVEPATAVVSFLEPSHPFDAEVISSFCHYVHFLVDGEAGERWISLICDRLEDRPGCGVRKALFRERWRASDTRRAHHRGAMSARGASRRPRSSTSLGSTRRARGLRGRRSARRRCRPRG